MDLFLGVGLCFLHVGFKVRYHELQGLLSDLQNVSHESNQSLNYVCILYSMIKFILQSEKAAVKKYPLNIPCLEEIELK